jgi:hypothetical protein
MRPLAAHRWLSGLLQTSRVAPAAAATPLCFVRAPHAGPPSVTLFTEALSEVWGVVKDQPTGQEMTPSRIQKVRYEICHLSS